MRLGESINTENARYFSTDIASCDDSVIKMHEEMEADREAKAEKLQDMLDRQQGDIEKKIAFTPAKSEKGVELQLRLLLEHLDFAGVTDDAVKRLAVIDRSLKELAAKGEDALIKARRYDRLKMSYQLRTDAKYLEEAFFAEVDGAILRLQEIEFTGKWSGGRRKAICKWDGRSYNAASEKSEYSDGEEYKRLLALCPKRKSIAKHSKKEAT